MFLLGRSPKLRLAQFGLPLFAAVAAVVIGVAGFAPRVADAATIVKADRPIFTSAPTAALDFPAVDLRSFQGPDSDPVRVGSSFSKTPNEINALGCVVTPIVTDGSTSGNARAPQNRNRFERSVYLITAAEMADAGFSSGSQPFSIGWRYAAAPGAAATGALIVYMENSADVANLKSNTWATAIAPMTVVHNASTTLPAVAGPFDITLAGGGPFTYTGGSVYVAFDFQYPVGTLGTTATVACNTTLANGLRGAQGATAPLTLTATAFRPETRLQAAVATINNDASVDYVIAFGQLPIGLSGAQTMQAVVTNRGANVLTNLPVTLTISGAESFTDTQIVPSLAACGGSATVTFSPFTPTVLGNDVITVSVPLDDNLVNSSKSRNLSITPPNYSYKHPGSTPVGGVGVAGTTASLIARFPVTAPVSVTGVTAEFTAAGNLYRAVVLDEFGTVLYVDAVDRTTVVGPVSITLPVPVSITGPEFYAGVQQTGLTNVSLAYDAEVPIRTGAFFLEIPIGSGFFDAAPGNNFKLNIGATLDRCDPSLAASNNGPICSGQTLELYATATNGLTWSWTGPNSFTSSLQNPTIPGATAAASGTYTVKVNGCATGVTTDAVVTPPYTITATAGAGGAISPSGAVAVSCGNDQAFAISAAACYSIADVLVDGVSVGAVSDYTFTNVQANHTIDASFALNAPSTITSSAGAGGSISPLGATAVACGGSQAYAIAADPCYAISDVLVDGSSVGAVSTYTFSNVTANHTIAASFALISYTITASAGPNGSISPSGAVAVNCGANQDFTIAANIGYNILDVIVDGGSVGAVSTYTFTNVQANHTISATFLIDATAVIGAQSSSNYICPTNTCETLPVTIARSANPAVLGFSVTLQLSGNLALCAGTGSITEGTFLSSAGATTFQIIDNGGGSYTVDGAVLGNACGPTALTGTLFSVGVGSAAAGGTGSVTVTSVTLRDCNNAPLPAIAGAPGTVPIDNQAPVVTVTSPNGGETWFIGSSQKVSWNATDNTGVANVDIDYSADGGATYPTSLAIAAANTGTFTWLVPGPATTQGRIRVTAHDVGCLSGADASDANFEVRDPVIVSSAGTNGSISPNGSSSVPYGTDQAYAITADPCYAIADVLVDGVSVGTPSSYTFTNVIADHTISATFVLATYTIMASAGAGGSIAPSGAVSVNCGSDASFSITANTCFAIQDVLVDGVSVGAVAAYTFTNVQANHTIAASFVSTTQATSTVLTVAPSPSVCQQPVTLTATVSPNTATGTVEFFDGVTSLGTAPVVAGVATLLPGALSVGAHTLSAVYTPTGCFLGSTSPNKAHTVNKAPVTVTLTSDINPSVWNQAVTFTATIVPATATGTVTFRDSLTVLGTVPVSGGIAVFIKSNLYTGNHTSMTATYNGDACYLLKASAAYSQLVYRAVSSVSVSTDINPSLCGQLIRITATVSPVGATGQARFYDNGNFMGTANFSGSTGLAVLTSSNLLPGKHDITVEYRGDTHYEPSFSNTYSQVVNPGPTSVTLASDLNPAKFGSKVNLTATVTPSDAGGSVQFFDDATSIGTALVSGGVATLSVTTELAAGSHNLTAVYGGDACNAGSTSPVLVQEITADSPPQVTVLFPNNHETLCIGGDVKLVWTATDNTAVASVQLEISRDNGSTWETLVASMPNTGSYVWRVTSPGTNVGLTEVYSALFRVTATDNAGVTGSDSSDGPFSIYDCVVATVITELDAEAIDLGIRIKWAFGTRNAFATVALERSPAETGPWAVVAAEVSEQGEATVAVDRTAEAGQTYFYRLRGTTAAGNTAVFGPVKATAGAPHEFALSAIWPNPSRGPVAMTFSVPRSAHVSLSVIDLQGREISSLAEGQFKAGRYQVNWDGRSDRGPVPAGLYFVRFITPDKKLVSRIAISH